MTAKTYLIGVDTGGTYTDAAVIEAQGHKVVASAKSITTKGDLSIGVTGAITAAVAKLPQGLKPEDISLSPSPPRSPPMRWWRGMARPWA